MVFDSFFYCLTVKTIYILKAVKLIYPNNKQYFVFISKKASQQYIDSKRKPTINHPIPVTDFIQQSVNISFTIV